MADEQDIVVEVDADNDADSMVTEQAPAKSGVVTTDDLKTMLETEKRQRRAAEDRASRAEREATQARSSAAGEQEARYHSEVSATDADIKARSTEIEAVAKAAESAFSEGRFSEGVQANRRMARLEAELVQLTQRKQWLTDNKVKLTATVTETSGRHLPDLSIYTPRQRKWIADHPEFVSDLRFQTRVSALHYAAVDEGIAVDSDEYFQFIDDGLDGGGRGRDGRGDVQQQEAVDAPAPKRATQRRDTSTTLPVQRRQSTAGSAGGGAPVRLSHDEREAADMMDPDTPAQGWRDDKGHYHMGRYERYAARKQQLKERGEL